ncbi:MAG: leucine--tRNA ligase [Owenweeksia sp.]
MEYNFSAIEKKWQQYWSENQVFKAQNNSEKPKYYVLDMFPYPSGAGLHVGHPLGYIASDIVSRFKRHKGFNVLHPMGYDSFGLPAEQYAIQTGQHPAITTKENIARYRQQMDKIGFSYDWSREVRTSNPDFYRWTQWIFLELFNSWYDKETNKAAPIAELITRFDNHGTEGTNAVCGEEMIFTPEEWAGYNEVRREEVLQNYRLAYRAESTVNWCPELGTVLANDEVKDGRSERGGYPVVQKKMMQWSMRISAYAQRLLEGLDAIDWPEPLKESQRNWIGRSEGASVHFEVKDSKEKIEVFTTRPDTIFGVSFMVLAPEHELVDRITTEVYRSSVEDYKVQAGRKTERDRMADVKTISGQFTGAYAIHPFTGKPIPVWIGDYVLASYGTGAVMSVPAHDSRDWAFAKHFGLPVPEVVAGGNIAMESYDAKEGKLINSEFLTGLEVKDAISKAIEEIEKKGIGKGKTNFRLRDAIFGRQRYWGEPIPVYYENGVPQTVKEEHLPLELPAVDAYLPTEDGEPPLARAATWAYHPEKGVVPASEGFPLETTTMPGWAGSSWYYLRYMDSENEKDFVGEGAEGYWKNVDLYIGGSEHATGHLLYSRFWHKFMFDRGWLSTREPFQKLINQGMILGTSAIAHRMKDNNTFISVALSKSEPTVPVHVDVNMVNASDELDVERFREWRDDLADAQFILEGDKFIVSREVEKMSKRWYNVVNPDDICTEYGADTLRMYEMFLGPLEQSKPWNTAGISGVYNFLKKMWRLYHSAGVFHVSDDQATKEELKSLHTLIKKVNEDIEQFSFNTSVSAFMICVNELGALKCTKREVLEPLAVLLSPFAPHIAEELWSLLKKGTTSISEVPFPVANEKYLVEDTFEYPVAFNGKMRFKEELSLSMGKEDIEKHILTLEKTVKYLEGKSPRKVIVVHGKIVNVVV